jgi:hypothetical protein
VPADQRDAGLFHFVEAAREYLPQDGEATTDGMCLVFSVMFFVAYRYFIPNTKYQTQNTIP